MLAGLAVAGILVSSVFAQDEAPKRKGRGRMAPPTYDKIVAANVGIKDGDDVTLDAFTACLKKNVPADAPEGAADRIVAGAPRIFASIATAAGKDADVKSLSKADYNIGQPKAAAKKGKKKGGNGDAPAPTGN
jgi:hypothetical protein